MPLCLNLSDSLVRQYVSQYGVRGTYQIYAQHDYWLPDFAAYQLQTETDLIPTDQAYQYLSSLVDLKQFRVDELENLPELVPQTTEAAFWQDTFYFGKQISRGALSEEAFHAIFQRLVPYQERADLLRVGQSLLKSGLKTKGFSSLKAYYENQKEVLPETYTRLSEEQGYDRLYEEALAQEFVRYSTYGSKSRLKPYSLNLTAKLTPYLGKQVASVVQKLLDGLFRGMQAIRNLFQKNQLYADLFFQKVNSGAYQTARIVEPGYLNTVPTTRLITLLNNDTLSVRESQQVIRNVGALAIQLQEQDETSSLSPEARLDKALELFADQYRNQGGKGIAIGRVLEPTYFNDDTFEDEVNPEYEKIRADIQTYLEELSVVTGIRDELDEDEVGMSEFAGYDKEANETGGYSGMSSWNKQYIALTGKQRVVNGIPQTHQIRMGESTISLPVIDIVDPDRVYYGLARAVSNTTALTDRLEKLLLYTEFDDTPTTGAFAEQLLKDLAPITYQPTNQYQELVQQYTLPEGLDTPLKLAQALSTALPGTDKAELATLSRKAFTKHQETSPALIRQQLQQAIRTNTLDKFLSSAGKQVLIKVLKGFDLWSRTNMNMRVDPSNGLSVASNANQNRAAKNLFNKWKSNYKPGVKAEDIAGYIPGEVAEVSLSYTNKDETEKAFRLLPEDIKIDRLNKAIISQSTEIRHRFERIGVNLSDAYVQYNIVDLAKKREPDLISVLDQTKAGSLPRLFYLPADLRITGTDLSLVKEFASQAEHSPFSKGGDARAKELAGGMTGRLERLAEGNAFFDESAFESNYQNAEGKTIYTYQNKTYSLDLFNWFTEVGLAKLNNLHQTGNRTLLRYENGEPVYVTEDSWTLKQNFLLNKLTSDPFYQANHSRFTAFTVDGIQQTALKRNGSLTATQIGAVAGEGVTYGSMSPREFDLFNLNSFYSLRETIDNRKLTPVFLGNRETSKTGEYLLLPLLEGLIQDGKLTQTGTELILSEVEKEYTRISKVYRDLQIDETGKASLKNPDQDQFTNYHTGKKLKKLTVLDGPSSTDIWVPTATKDFRGLQFSDAVTGLLGSRQVIPTTADPDNLIIQAMLGNPFPKDKLDNVLQQQVRKILDSHLDRYVTEGIWDKKKQAGTKLLDKAISKADLETKLVSDWVNGISVAQLAYGDAGLLYKNDGIDVFKRLKGLNAAIVSFAVPFGAPELGIDGPSTHFSTVTVAEPTASSDVSGSSIDLADAQGYDSVQARRRSLYGQGKLTTPLAQILDAIQEGKPIRGKDLDTLLASGVMFNSEKTVGATGQLYKKLSVSMLSKELTADPVAISQAEYEAVARLDSYGRTQLQPGAPEVSSYVDESGNRQYFRWEAKPHKKSLHEQRLLMDGFRFQSGSWQYVGTQARVDLITPISASKTLNPNVHQDVKGQQVNWQTVREKSVHLIDLNYYGLQTENPSGKTKIVDPTQMLEIIVNELGSDVQIYHDGKLLSKTQIEPLWQQYLKARDDVNYQIASKVFEDENGDLDLTRFRQKAFENILATGGDKQTVALFDPESGYNLNLPLTRDKFISLFFSHFSKEVLSHKRAGDSLAHVSSHGHELIKKVFINEAGYLDWQVIRESSAEYQALQAEDLLSNLPSLTDYRYKHEFQTDPKTKQKTRLEPDSYRDNPSWFARAKELLSQSEYGDESGKQVLYVRDSLRHLKPRWEKVNGKLTQTGYFSEALMPASDSRVTELDNGIRYNFGVRIPSQDKHSAMNIEWVDTLPPYLGSSIVTVKEVVELSGSDFDIDKLYLTKPEGYWQEYTDGSQQFVPYGSATTLGDEWEEYTHYVLDHYKPVKQLARDIGEEAAFRRFNLPATEAEFGKLSRSDREQMNVGVIHNRMLSLQQGLLANNTSIDDSDPVGGQYNQPANLDKLNALKNEQQDGVNLFGESQEKISVHWPIVHSRVHEKNQVGKALIGIAVNANLFLINAVKLGFKVDPRFIPSLDDGRTHSGVYTDRIIDSDGQATRVFDVNSTLITANTDEAKEGLNAFYQLSTDAQAAVIHMVGLGYDLLSSLLLVNQPAVQAYIQLTEKAKNIKSGRGVASQEEQDLRFLDRNGIATRVLQGEKLPEEGELNKPYTKQQLRENLAAYRSGKSLPHQIQGKVLNDFMNLVAVNEYASNFVRFIKMKKGFGQDLPQFDRIIEAGSKLKFYGNPPVPDIINIKEQLQKNSPLAAQYLNIIKSIVPENRDLQKRVLLRRHPAFVEMVRGLTAHVGNNVAGLSVYGEKQTELITQAVETYLFTKLYENPLGQTNSLSLNQVFTDGGEEQLIYKLNQFKEQYAYVRTNPITGETEKGPFADNPVFEFLVPEQTLNGVSMVKLNTIVKLRPEQQEELLDSFRNLYTKEVNGGFPGRDMAVNLVNYFVIKDGWQFTMGNISKLFGPEAFGQLSQAVTQFQQNNQVYPTDEWTADLLTHLGRDVNYGEFLPSLKLPSKKSSVKQTVDDSGIIQYEDLAGNAVKELNSQLILTNPVTKEGTWDAGTVSNVNLMGSEKGLKFPRFLQVKTYITVEDEYTGERSNRQVIKRYELVSVIDPENKRLDISAIQKRTSVEGHKARYVELIQSGAPRVSAATGLGQHYTEKAQSELNKRISQTTGAAQNYYQTLSTYRIKPEVTSSSEEVLQPVEDYGIDGLETTSVNDLFGNQSVGNQIDNSYIQEMKPTQNIWFSSEENAGLSNLATRPFTDKQGRNYYSVEHAYQSWKSGQFDEATYNKYTKGGTKIMGKLGTKTDNNWNITLMKQLMKASFEQNPTALATLLATGNSTLTHNQDTGIWKTAFPKLLMEIRTELAPNFQSDADFKLDQPCA